MLPTASHRPLGCGTVEELTHTSVHTCRAWWRSKHTKAEQRHLRETEAATGQQQWLLSVVGVLPLSPEPGVTGVGLELLETGCSES